MLGKLSSALLEFILAKNRTEDVFKIIDTMKRNKKTIILVEHKVDLIAEYAEEIFVLKDGELIRSGNSKDVLTDISLIKEGVQLPQVAILGNKLINEGFPLCSIPITEDDAVNVIGNLLKEV